MIINLSDRRSNPYMRSDNLRLPRVQPSNSSYNLQLPHGCQCHHSCLAQQDRTGQDKTGQDRTRQDRTGEDSTGQDKTDI